MSFDIYFRKCLSEKNVVNKRFASSSNPRGLKLTGVLKDDTSMLDPIIIIQYDNNSISSYNYFEIDSFNGRKYFITDIISLSNSFIEIHGHVDVLSSFKESLLTNTAIIKSQESKYNLYLNDGSFKVYQNPIVVTKSFPAGFNTQEFVLAIAGS